MRLTPIIAFASGLICAGCVTTEDQGKIWQRIDGQPIAGNRSETLAFKRAELICEGRLGATPAGMGTEPVVAMKGCMAEYGYWLQPPRPGMKVVRD